MSARSRRIPLVAVGLLAALTAAACADDKGSSGSGGSASDKIAVAASDTSCTVDTTELDAGVHKFAVTNSGSKVTEFYVYAEGDRIMGEVENIAPGVARDLQVELPAGDYETACKPGMVGDGIRGDLKVTGAAAELSDDQALSAAVDSYTTYVQSQVGALQDQTTKFVDAIKAGKSDDAKALFPIARSYYERIEPVAESFGDLDPKIDARENDVEPGDEWTGFHVLEKDLWDKNDISQSGSTADQLLADVNSLADEVAKLELKPLDLANGAQGLLDEIATSKITGEEDRYSHTDLYDFFANLDGSRAAVQSLRPVIEEKDPDLAKALDEQFAAAQAELDKYRQGDGWKLYTELTPDQTKALSDSIGALTAQVAKVPDTITG